MLCQDLNPLTRWVCPAQVDEWGHHLPPSAPASTIRLSASAASPGSDPLQLPSLDEMQGAMPPPPASPPPGSPPSGLKAAKQKRAPKPWDVAANGQEVFHRPSQPHTCLALNRCRFQGHGGQVRRVHACAAAKPL